MTLTRIRPRLHLIVPALLITAGCNSSTPASPSVQLQVGGSYDVLKTTTTDTCSGTIGAPITTPSTVSHSAGATSFTLIDHGTRSLPGTVTASGAMAMDVARSTVMETIQATDTFTSGRFTTTGFEVTDTTDLADNPNRRGSGPCRVVATWRGTKQGAPNVIPD